MYVHINIRFQLLDIKIHTHSRFLVFSLCVLHSYIWCCSIIVNRFWFNNDDKLVAMHAKIHAILHDAIHVFILFVVLFFSRPTFDFCSCKQIWLTYITIFQFTSPNNRKQRRIKKKDRSNNNHTTNEKKKISKNWDPKKIINKTNKSLNTYVYFNNVLYLRSIFRIEAVVYRFVSQIDLSFQ